MLLDYLCKLRKFSLLSVPCEKKKTRQLAVDPVDFLFRILPILLSLLFSSLAFLTSFPLSLCQSSFFFIFFIELYSL